MLTGASGRESAADNSKVHIQFQHPFEVFLNPWLDAVRPSYGKDAGHVQLDANTSPHPDADDNSSSEELEQTEQAVFGDQ
jgi:hypothetical protein